MTDVGKWTIDGEAATEADVIRELAQAQGPVRWSIDRTPRWARLPIVRRLVAALGIGEDWRADGEGLDELGAYMRSIDT